MSPICNVHCTIHCKPAEKLPNSCHMPNFWTKAKLALLALISQASFKKYLFSCPVPRSDWGKLHGAQYWQANSILSMTSRRYGEPKRLASIWADAETNHCIPCSIFRPQPLSTSFTPAMLQRNALLPSYNCRGVGVDFTFTWPDAPTLSLRTFLGMPQPQALRG